MASSITCIPATRNVFTAIPMTSITKRRVAAYAPDGTLVQTVETPGAPQSSCPAFGGAELTTLYVTTALEHMDAAARAKHPASGQVFAFAGVAKGLPEPQVIL